MRIRRQLGANTGNGYYGGLQFSQASWDNVGGDGHPSEAPKGTQIEMGKTAARPSGLGGLAHLRPPARLPQARPH